MGINHGCLRNNDMPLLVSIFFVAAFVAVLSWPVATFVGSRFQIIDYPDERKIHSIPTLRTGGILIFSGFILGILISSGYHIQQWAFVLFSALMFILGFTEDMYRLSAKKRLAFQGIIALLYTVTADAYLIDLGVFALPGFLLVPFTVFAIVGVTNAFNIADGMNGLSSGLGLVAAASLGILAFVHGDQEVLKFAILLVGALTGFMIFNLKGKIFMGDSGSYLTGFVVSALSVMLVTRNPDVSPFAPLLIVFVPVFDTLYAIWRRKRLGNDPFMADKMHFHHMMRMKYRNDGKAVIVILLVQSAAALAAILFEGNTMVLAVTAVFMVFFLQRLWLGGARLVKN